MNLCLLKAVFQRATSRVPASGAPLRLDVLAYVHMVFPFPAPRLPSVRALSRRTRCERPARSPLPLISCAHTRARCRFALHRRAGCPQPAAIASSLTPLASPITALACSCLSNMVRWPRP
eukprot:6197748-Pleurochrysis_carterae.AAC.1